ncbi:hypothetical protein H072_4613 [Dactylellina haptotyla CBS 200.50]|uniref:Arrestin C-terminal-like domain-containing protein n=1 Tax=Dactylellina haptotyla (strain CBS 200.50) TaxID=1284197 RepID=S8AJZ4_DACHA|nr:hypothetical protein H072_4613 [Dactylellina haptotyla CBS 200.50]
MKKITLFEIRLDEEVLVLRGDTTEAPGVQLSGKIVISCTEPVNVKSLSIKVTCLQRFRVNEVFNGAWGPTMKMYKHEHIMFMNRKVPIGEKTVIPAGNHEYPFQWVLDGNAPESVEGFGEAGILWDLQAHLERSVYLSDVHASKHFRVIRTLPHTALEFSQTMAVENVWPNKVEYTVSTPSKAVVFGSYIPIEVRLTPLLKGLQVSKISVSLKEVYELTPQSKEITGTRHISEAEYPGWEDPPSEDDEGAWILREKIFLPQTLAKCLQDCEVGKIKIRHKLKFAIQLKNPDGHISELRATLPIMLFISQHYLTNEQNEVPIVTNQVTSESEVAAPPRYEQHQLDELFDGVDLDMYLSRTNSPILLSRSGSAENLQQLHSSGLTPLSSLSGTSSPMFGHDTTSTSRSSNVSSNSMSGPSLLTAHGHADLIARLQRAHQRPAGSSGSLNALANSTSWTNPSSGRESPTPDSPADNLASLSSSPTATVDMLTMCKVPSYSTAIKTPTRNLSFEDSPAYERVASGPPSRTGSYQNLAELDERPGFSRSSSESGTSGRDQAEDHSSEGSSHAISIGHHPHRASKMFSPRWRS